MCQKDIFDFGFYLVVKISMTIDEPVTVGIVGMTPKYLVWNGRSRTINKVGLHHFFREGRTLFHVFSVVSGSMFFRLVLNTETLKWRLSEVSDGLSD